MCRRWKNGTIYNQPDSRPSVELLRRFRLRSYVARVALILLLLEMRTDAPIQAVVGHKQRRTEEVPMNDCTYSTRMLCFLVGGLAGVTATLLLAPQSGKATREAMRRTLRESTDSARALKDQVIRRGGEVRDEAAHRVTAAASALAGRGANDAASA